MATPPSQTSVIEAALIRAARTFAQTFVGIILAAWIAGGVGNARLTGLWDAVVARWDFAAGAGLIAALAAVGLNLVAPGPTPAATTTTSTGRRV